MKLGGEYRLAAADRASTWRRPVDEVGLATDEVGSRVVELATSVGPAFETAAADHSVTGLRSDPPERLVDGVVARAELCLRVLT